ncbi:MAG: alpha/beta hydrolase [Marmoricola sp.]
MALRVPAWVLPPGLRLLKRFVYNPTVPFAKQRSRAELVLRLGMRVPRTTTLEDVDLGGVPCLRVAAPRADPARRVVHLYGGAYCIGSTTMARSFAHVVSSVARAVVYVPAYRLAPEHPFPAALDDSLAVWRALTANAGVPAPALMGDSAGAGLAVATTLELQAAGEPVPAGLGLVCAWLDLTRRHAPSPDPVLSPAWMKACGAAYRAGADPADPRISPALADLADLGGLPPVRLVSATHDLLYPDSVDFEERARAAGVRVQHEVEQGLWHDYPLQAGTITAGDRAAAGMGRFLAGCWD